MDNLIFRHDYFSGYVKSMSQTFELCHFESDKELSGHLYLVMIAMLSLCGAHTLYRCNSDVTPPLSALGIAVSEE